MDKTINDKKINTFLFLSFWSMLDTGFEGINTRDRCVDAGFRDLAGFDGLDETTDGTCLVVLSFDDEHIRSGLDGLDGSLGGRAGSEGTHGQVVEQDNAIIAQLITQDVGEEFGRKTGWVGGVYLRVKQVGDHNAGERVAE